MNNNQWKVFCEFRTAFKQKILEWNALVPDLSDLQKKAAELAGTPEYSFENPIVYNTDLDKISAAAERREQQARRNQKAIHGILGEGLDNCLPVSCNR